MKSNKPNKAVLDNRLPALSWDFSVTATLNPQSKLRPR